MKKSYLFPALGVSLLALTSCNGNQQSDNKIELVSYQYDNIAKLTHPDSLAVSEEGDEFYRLVGEGVLPVAIGQADITQLRDTLQTLGRVEYVSRHEVSPRFSDEVELTALSPDSVEAGNYRVNNLSMVLLTPRVAVWKSYMAYYVAHAAHGRYRTTYVNYSLDEHKVLSLDDIFKKGYEKPLTEMLAERAKENPEIFSDADIRIPDTWRITDDGITFVYGLYDIAPYSAGEVEIPLALYELADLMKPNPIIGEPSL